MALQVFLLLLFLWSPTSAEKSPSPTFPGITSHLRPTTAVTVTILVITFALTVFFFLYCRHRRPLQRYRIPSSREPPFISFAPHGLDRRLLASFPTLLYSDVKAHKLSKHALECAVCLCEFEDHETLTLVPRCDHAFHPDCISMWLSSHVTCPVCRRALDVEEEEEEEKVPGVLEVDVEVAHVAQVDEEEAERGSERSKSGRWWTDAESERFRLVLPEEVVERKRIGRSESERREHAGYQLGSGRRLWKWDRGARSEHWGGAVVNAVSGGVPTESHGTAREMDTATLVGSYGGGGESSGTTYAMQSVPIAR